MIKQSLLMIFKAICINDDSACTSFFTSVSSSFDQRSLSIKVSIVCSWYQRTTCVWACALNWITHGLFRLLIARWKRTWYILRRIPCLCGELNPSDQNYEHFEVLAPRRAVVCECNSLHHADVVDLALCMFITHCIYLQLH